MSDEKVWISVQDLLQEESDAELASRDGQWAAFREQIQWRLDREAGSVRQMSWEDQAIRVFADEVETEVAVAAHRFEGSFREELESRIFREGIATPSRWARLVASARAAFASGPSWAMAGGLAAAAVVVGLGLRPNGAEVEIRPGTVMVDSLSFEGSAVVTVDEGVTVVMLASAAE